MKLEARGLRVSFGKKDAVKDVTIAFPGQRVTALIGPSGCGKSTLLRALNRMHDRTPGARIEGQVLLDGEDIYAPGADVPLLRTRIGMVFQKPNPFPTMSIADNVRFAPRNLGLRDRKQLDAIVVESLRAAALWGEVKDRLDAPAVSLSGGQQQRLCIARALAVDPEVLLMDEPCSALDPLSTERVEDLIVELRKEYCVVVVTHNMQQAARVSDYTGFLWLGELVEHGPTRRMFEEPQEERTEAYLTGRVG